MEHHFENVTDEEVRELAEDIRHFLHKVNNTLFIVSGKAQLLTETAMDADLRGSMEQIFTKIQSAAELLKDVYSISRKYQNYGLSMQIPPLSALPEPRRDTSGLRRILIADGDFVNLEVLMDLLEGEHALVWAAQNFDSLREQLRHNRYDYVLVDEQLPGLNLDTFHEEIRQLPEGITPKVGVLVTGDRSATSDFFCIMKPVSIEKLQPFIESIETDDRQCQSLDH